MAKRIVNRRGADRIGRINSIAPKYIKGLALLLAIGMVVVIGMVSWNSEADPSSGRRLMKTLVCKGDTILPLVPFEDTWDVGLRATFYMFFLGFLFLGVAISADTFMAAIEVITSKTNTVNIGGQEVEVEVWNGTVANLTLMALGSSAPEILLAVVETCALTFQAGDLGPGTIVGSAAFNLLFITAICISCLPEDENDSSRLESRKIEEFGVFGITAVASLWAYLWMVVALSFISADVVDLWEAVFTFIMFPILVVLSYGQDQAWWGMCGSSKVAPGDGPTDHSSVKSITGEDGKKRRTSNAHVLANAEINSADADELKLDPEAAARKAAQDAMKKKKKSRLEYRIQATRKMTGGKRVLPSGKDKKAATDTETPLEVNNEPITEIVLDFAEAKYEVDESCGTCIVKVVRSGITDKSCSIQFDTSDGDASSTDDYVSTAGTLQFKADETEKEISITIIDDNEWAPDKHFFVRLYGAKAEENSGVEIKVNTATTQVIILNDDDPGSIGFQAKTFHAMDTKTKIEIPLVRKDGYDGNVLAFIKTTDGTAKAGEDFTALPEDHEVHFDDKIREGKVQIELLKNGDNANSTFTVQITGVEPEGAKVGETNMCTVIITNDENYKKLMEDVVAMMDDEMGKYGVGTSSWGEQFHDAMNMGGDDDSEPEFSDYLMHFLSFYWKVLHALVPPTDYVGGWATFVVSLIFIGIITCFVGDAAKILGCCMGLKDAVTAITFVALGTSLPDTFASMEATVSDDTADAAITNVTGSNSVNVFLGLGVPWLMATCYHAANDTTFIYPAGDLVFSVLVFFAFAFVCIGLLVVRRFTCDGELGGNKVVAYASSAFLGFSWFAYIVLSSMKTYKHF